MFNCFIEKKGIFCFSENTDHSQEKKYHQCCSCLSDIGVIDEPAQNDVVPCMQHLTYLVSADRSKVKTSVKQSFCREFFFIGACTRLKYFTIFNIDLFR